MDTVTHPAREGFTIDDIATLPSGGRRLELVDGAAFMTGAPFTLAELQRMPDDGNRYELMDGMLVVTPAPSRLHQAVVANVYDLLSIHRSPSQRVLFAPLDVVLNADTVIQPDVVVLGERGLTEARVAGPPLLAVEVLSPFTKGIDRQLKFELLRVAGCPSYWIVDPAGPRVTAWDLVDGDYIQVGDVAADAAWTASLPFEVTLVPSELVR